MGRNRFRRLIVDQQTYFWRVGHDHAKASGDAEHVTGCSEFIDLRRQSIPGRMRIMFRAGPGHLVSDGYPRDDGIVARASDATHLNLHRPGVARALLEEVLSTGWSPGQEAEADGWSLFDAVIHRVTPEPWTPFA